jgi:hypothetical protein
MYPERRRSSLTRLTQALIVGALTFFIAYFAYSWSLNPGIPLSDTLNKVLAVKTVVYTSVALIASAAATFLLSLTREQRLNLFKLFSLFILTALVLSPAYLNLILIVNLGLDRILAMTISFLTFIAGIVLLLLLTGEIKLKSRTKRKKS